MQEAAKYAGKATGPDAKARVEKMSRAAKQVAEFVRAQNADGRAAA